jgi:nucleotide-binding universal stress UspA family protein
MVTPFRSGRPYHERMASADWKRICCPVDFSDASRAAMEVAADLARRAGASLTLLHAYPIPGYTFPDGSVVASARMMQELADQAAKHLAEWRREAEALGAAPVEAVTAAGEPASEILGHAARHGIDLLVLGTHGRSGLEHALLGSVTERVVRKARCHVLTVHPGTA